MLRGAGPVTLFGSLTPFWVAPGPVAFAVLSNSDMHGQKSNWELEVVGLGKDRSSV